MNKKVNTSYEIKRYFVVIVASIIYTFAVSKFLTPNGFLTGGVTGIALLVVKIFGLFDIVIDKGVLVFLLNLPLLILAYKGLHRSFFLLSLISIGIQSFLFSFLNLEPILTNDMLVNGLIGGGIVGACGGFCLKYGGSTGGMDILGQYIALHKNNKIKVGTYSLMINCLILIVSLIFFGPEVVIYTLFGFIANAFMVNKVHTSYSHVRVEIVTQDAINVKEAILQKYIHGVTIYDHVIGGYSGTKLKVLESICYKYEVEQITSLVLSIDPKAFITTSPVNIYSGNFVRKVIS